MRDKGAVARRKEFITNIARLCPELQRGQIERAYDAWRAEFETAIKKAMASGCVSRCDAIASLHGKAAYVLLQKIARLWKVSPAVRVMLNAKLVPWMMRDKTLCDANAAALDLNYSRGMILGAALRNDKQFFIYLGKFLSGEINPKTFDQLDLHVAELVCANRSIKATEAERELKKRGWKITEDGFRMRKKRLGLSEPMRKRNASLRDTHSRKV